MSGSSPSPDRKSGTLAVTKPLEYQPLDLNHLRNSLIRQEESIVFALIERAQFKQNLGVYDPNAFDFGPEFQGSFLDYLLLETESLHSKVRRWFSLSNFRSVFPLS
jgi:hypothetical protein